MIKGSINVVILVGIFNGSLFFYLYYNWKEWERRDSLSFIGNVVLATNRTFGLV